MKDQLETEYGKDTAIILYKVAKGMVSFCRMHDNRYKEGWLSEEGGDISAVQNCITYIILHLEAGEQLEDACYNGGGDYMRYLGKMYSLGLKENQNYLYGSLDIEPGEEGFSFRYRELIVPSAEEEFFSDLDSSIESPEEEEKETDRRSFPSGKTPSYKEDYEVIVRSAFRAGAKAPDYFLDYADRGGWPSRHEQGIIEEVAAIHGVSYRTVTDAIRRARARLANLVHPIL